MHAVADELGLQRGGLATDAPRVICGRRRRWGEDVRNELLQGLAKKCRAQHASSTAAVLGIDSRRLSEWHSKELVAQHAAGMWVFGELTGTFVVASGGARLGKPAEDTNLYIAAHHGSGYATWLVPQALGTSGPPLGMVRAGISSDLLAKPIVPPFGSFLLCCRRPSF